VLCECTALTASAVTATMIEIRLTMNAPNDERFERAERAERAERSERQPEPQLRRPVLTRRRTIEKNPSEDTHRHLQTSSNSKTHPGEA
jgi:hypothetical protein